jgi:Uma2 family endonuclease
MTVREMQRLFTVEEYHRMAEAGILHEDDRVELIEGRTILTAAIGSRHAACVKRLVKLLVREVGDSGVVGAQDPVVLPGSSEPELDTTVLHPRDDFYAAGHPVPGDVLLLIEVSDTSLEYDRKVKLPLYASAGIPEVWIVDLVNQNVHAYSRSTAGSYGNTYSVERSDSIAPRMLPDLVVNLDEILG